jgi:serine protease inhibitor
MKEVSRNGISGKCLTPGRNLHTFNPHLLRVTGETVVNHFLLRLLLVSLVVVAVVSASRAEDGPKALAETDVKALVGGNNEFALDLYARLAKKEGNLVFSPYSVSNALAMTYAGARGETAEEMAKVLHFTLGQERLHPAFGELIADLQKDDKNRPYSLHVANSLWGQKGYPFVDGFLRISRKNYGAGLQEVDFARTEEARATINRWVEEQTRDKVKELLSREHVTPATRLFLVNAIYFKGAWEMPFRKDKTEEAPFELKPDEKVNVATMTSPEGVFNYASGDDAQWVDLPYKGHRLAMVVVLPQKKGGLAAFETGLTAKALQEAVGKLKPHWGPVSLPRFKVTTDCRLGETLKEMGMSLAFSGEADFGGIVKREALNITAVVHKADIDVDELGTEAAAATGVGFASSGYTPFAFRADRPFLFLIRDKQTGSILFLGRVTDPRP